MTSAPGLPQLPVFRRAPGVLHRSAGADVLLLIRRRGQQSPALLELAGSGAALWHTLAEPRSARDCAGRLAEAYGVPPATVEHDITPVLGELADLGALEQVADPE